MKTDVKRGRPRKFDEDQTLDRIMQVFWQNGYAATSLDDITGATGLNRPSLYAAFGSKKDMFLKIIDRFVERMEDYLRKAGRTTHGLKPRLTAILNAAIELYTGQTPMSGGSFGCLAISTLPPVAIGDPDFRNLLAQVTRRMDLGFADLLRQEMQTDVSLASAEDTAQQLSLLLHGLSVRARAGESPDELKRIAAGAVDKLVPLPE